MDLHFEVLRKLEGPVPPTAPDPDLHAIRQQPDSHAVRCSSGNPKGEQSVLHCRKLRRACRAGRGIPSDGVITGQKPRADVAGDRQLLVHVLAVVGDGVALQPPVVEARLETAEKPRANVETVPVL